MFECYLDILSVLRIIEERLDRRGSGVPVSRIGRFF